MSAMLRGAKRGLAAAVMFGAATLISQQVYADPIGLAKAGSGQLEVESDNGIEWRRNDNILIARGNAVARRGNSRIDADELRAMYRNKPSGSEIYRIEGIGHVKLSSNTDTATGDKAIYDIDQAVVVLTGKNLKYTTPQDTLTAKDSLEYWETKRMAVARGNAVAVSQNKVLKGDVLTARFAAGAKGGNELQRIDAYGHVIIETPTDYVTGDQGVYDAKTGIATLTGSVKITRGKNQLNGDKAVVDLNTGVSRLTSGGKNGGKSRVRGLLVPEKKDKAPAGTKSGTAN